MKTRIVALSALTLVACGGNKEQLTQLPGGEISQAEAETLTVNTTRVGTGVVSRSVIATGTLEPAREANLGPQMTARVANVLVKEGDKVNAGQPLVLLDSVEASLRAQQVAANVANTEAQYELAKGEYERMAPLVAKGTVTAQAIERLSRMRDSAKAAAEAAKAQEADAKRHIGNASVRAPFAGVVSKVYVEIGEVATMMPVTLLVRLVDLSSVDVRVRVHERELSGVAIGNEVHATFSASGEKATGQVAFISPEIDPRTRTAEVVTRIPNADGKLRAGTFAEIAISPSSSHNGLTLASSAVAGTGANRYVFAIKGGSVERTKVRVAPLGTDSVEVLEGLSVGDEVVRDGLGRLGDGAHIKRANAEAKAEAKIEAAPGNAAEKPAEAKP
jgi:membrane fusion protein (multidrug efflux system)